jgi:hypothetical protein
MFTSAGVLLDQTLFGGKIAETTNRIDQSIQNNPGLKTAINIVNNSLGFGFGAVSQYLNDMSFGMVGNLLHINWENGGTAFQTGRELGRTVSTIQGIVEFFTGAATAAISLSSMPPTGGLTIPCAALTGGGCLPVGGVALTIEGVGVLGGSALAGHGVGLELYNNHNQIKSGGNSLSDPTLGYGSNTRNTRDNAKLLRENMGVGETPGYAAHHIVPSTNPYESAREARELLEEFDIDINNKGNGTLVTYSLNSHLNSHPYMDAVLESLQDAKNSGATKEEIINVLQDIAKQIEITGDYP